MVQQTQTHLKQVKENINSQAWLGGREGEKEIQGNKKNQREMEWKNTIMEIKSSEAQQHN